MSLAKICSTSGIDTTVAIRAASISRMPTTVSNWNGWPRVPFMVITRKRSIVRISVPQPSASGIDQPTSTPTAWCSAKNIDTVATEAVPRRTPPIEAYRPRSPDWTIASGSPPPSRAK